MKQGFSMFLMVGAGCAVSARLGVMITTARRDRGGRTGGSDGQVSRVPVIWLLGESLCSRDHQGGFKI